MLPFICCCQTLCHYSFHPPTPLHLIQSTDAIASFHSALQSLYTYQRGLLPGSATRMLALYPEKLDSFAHGYLMTRKYAITNAAKWQRQNADYLNTTMSEAATLEELRKMCMNASTRFKCGTHPTSIIVMPFLFPLYI
jgi:hypothetical protein